MKTTDEIEREIHTKFAAQVFNGMRQDDYLAALTHVVIRYTAEYLATPCLFEARGDGSVGGSGRAWCQSHGFDCPKLRPTGQ